MGLFKRIKNLEDKVKILEEKVVELSKKTISQTTTEKETPATTSEILDEWLNGKEEDNGN